MEKIKLGKHDHKLTNILKFFIFSIIMIAPFLSVLASCLYVANNKNAKESYSGTTILDIEYRYQSNEVNSVNDLVEGNIYQFNVATLALDDFLLNSDYISIKCVSECNFTYYEIDDNYIPDGENVTTYNSTPLVLTAELVSLLTYRDDTITDYGYVDFSGVMFQNSFIIQLIEWDLQNMTQEWVTNLFSYTGYNQIESFSYDDSGTLDNVFYYSVNQIPNQQLFAWTKNTAIYTPINNMCVGLGWDANNNVLAVLLTYWSLNIAIYIVFDIIIFTFTKLTHFLNN